MLQMMEKASGGDPRPMRVLAAINPEFVYEQARSRKFVMEQPHIPPKYKHLIMIAVAAAVESQMCTTVFMRGAKLAGVTKEEIAEAIMVARQARASTIFATAVEGFETLLEDTSGK
jgi:AhpD family alkylhydroperoxidase